MHVRLVLPAATLLLSSVTVACGGALLAGPDDGATDSGPDTNVPQVDAGAPIDAMPPDVSQPLDAGPTEDVVVFDVSTPPPLEASTGAPEAAPPPSPPPPACYAGTSVATFAPWKPPTPLHQGACTASDLATYGACWTSADCSSGSATCDACMRTDASAAAYGPIITGTAYADMYEGALVNWGGCQANLDGDTGPGSCGNQTNDWQTCFVLECPSSCGSEGDDCGNYAWTHACQNDTESIACSDEWSSQDSGVPQCSQFATLASLWCGP
jgi:hypothetical protein